jgi:hypothetical protein
VCEIFVCAHVSVCVRDAPGASAHTKTSVRKTHQVQVHTLKLVCTHLRVYFSFRMRAGMLSHMFTYVNLNYSLDKNTRRTTALQCKT